MTKIRIIGMALLAVFCLSAVVASSALAVEKKGEIVNSKGEAPKLNKFTGESANAGKLETVAGSKIECTKTKVSGTILSKTTGESKFTFTGCVTTGKKCNSVSPLGKEGEVITNVSLLGANESKTNPKGEKDFIKNTTTEETSIECGTTKITIKKGGSLLVKVLKENFLSTENEFEAAGSKGVQTPELAAGQGTHLQAKFLGTGVFENASISATGLKVKFEEAVEAI
jgi:hypothetical protein